MPKSYLCYLLIHTHTYIYGVFPGDSDGKESACSAGDPDSNSGLGRSPGEGNGYTLQYSCLDNPHGQRNLAGYSPWGHKELDVTEWPAHSLSHTHIYICICSVSSVVQSCLSLCDCMDCSPPGSSVHWILQVRTLEWVAMPSSRGSSWPRNQTPISCVSSIEGGFFTAEPPGMPPNICTYIWQPRYHYI